MAKANKNGKLIIFSMQKSRNLQESPDFTSTDRETLKRTFAKYNADVNEVYINLTKSSFDDAIRKISKDDFKNYKYFVVAILTHGDCNGKLSICDENHPTINLNLDVIIPILRNETLSNKPKLFIVDACKGPFDVLSADVDARPFGAPNPTNLLRCYSTTEGFKAFHTKENGSVFTSEFCKLLVEKGEKKSVEEIMKLTIEAVKKKTQKLYDRCQIPSYETTMTKPFILGKYI